MALKALLYRNMTLRNNVDKIYLENTHPDYVAIIGRNIRSALVNTSDPLAGATLQLLCLKKPSYLRYICVTPLQIRNSGVSCYVGPTATRDLMREVYLSVRVKARMSHLNPGISKNLVRL